MPPGDKPEPTRTPSGRVKGRRKNGTFAKKRTPPPPPQRAEPKGPCSVYGCEVIEFCKGLCRPHYTRLRRYGDPLGAGRKGGPVMVPAAFARAGITDRQRTHWAASGYLGLERDDKGRYVWTAQSVRVAILIHRLTSAGMELKVAADIAGKTVVLGRTVHDFGPGAQVVIADDTHGVSAA